jgi:hypothetical protein
MKLKQLIAKYFTHSIPKHEETNILASRTDQKTMYFMPNTFCCLDMSCHLVCDVATMQRMRGCSTYKVYE